MQQQIFYEIDGLRFSTVEYDFDHGWTLFGRLFQMCGKTVLSFLVEGLDGVLKEALSGDVSRDQVLSMQVTELFGKLDKKKIVDSFDWFLERLDPTNLFPLTADILTNTDIALGATEKRAINFNVDLKGRYGTVIKLIRKVLMYQYGASFQGLLGGLTEPTKSVIPTTIGKVTARNNLKSTGGTGV